MIDFSQVRALLESAFDKRLKCSFYNDYVLFDITTRKNLFEISNLFVSLKNTTSIEKFFNEISSVYNLIDYFKLGEKN